MGGGQLSTMIATLILIVIIQMVQAKIYHVEPRKTLPISHTLFAYGGSPESRGSYRKVREHGDLSKWVQTVNNITVYGSVLITQNDQLGHITSVEGFIAEPYSFVRTTPSISPLNAVESLMEVWNHSRVLLAEARIDEPELLIMKYGIADKLVWKVSYYVSHCRHPKCSGSAPAFVAGLVNAHTGKVVKSWDNMHNAKIKGIVGNEKIGKSYEVMDVYKKENSPMCHHSDAKRRILVVDMKQKNFTDYTADEFICDDAVKVNWDMFNDTGSYSPRNEAFINAAKFVDMWDDIQPNKSISPYRLNESWLLLMVHYGEHAGNAEFTGNLFLFGDGDEYNYPPTSLDIVCHELAHGVTEWKGAKLENSGESGAINEAYSDIVGQTCNIYYKVKEFNGDYLIGEQIMKPNRDIALRDMCNPSKLGGLENFRQYKVNSSTHEASGIYSKAWCKLTKTKGWDYAKSFNAFTYANLMNTWKADLTMHCGACGVESAAKKLGFNPKDVTAAFASVGVYCSSCQKSMLLQYGLI